MTKIGFVVIATEEDPWKTINEDGQEPTWLSDLGDCDHYIAAYSLGNLGDSQINPRNHRKVQFLGDSSRTHRLSDPEFFKEHHARFEGVRGYASLVGTTLSAINYLVNESDCDFIVRTNVSSYWGIENLRSFLTDKPRKNYYAGRPENLYAGIRGRIQDIQYASGAGMILSVDVAKRLVKNHTKISTSFIDDIAIGRIASTFGLKLDNLTRVDIESLEVLEKLSSEVIANNYHFRCKCYMNPGLAEPRGDIEIMKALHRRRGILSSLRKN